MFTEVPVEYRRRRNRFQRRRGPAQLPEPPPPPPPPPPAAPTLTAAFYSAGQEQLDLTFDRAVDVSAIVPAQITVDDPVVNLSMYRGTAAPQIISPTRFILPLVVFDLASGTEQLLNASATTGIVAVDGGLPWAGVTNLALPLPPVSP